MSLRSSRGLVRAAINPGCEMLAAMALEVGDERDFYREVTGEEYPAEYGERASARRRGSKFENNNHRNNAAPLRERLAEHLRTDPEKMYVRNLADEIPGPPDRMHAVRLHRTRGFLRDLVAGRAERVPDLVIQPTLELPILGGSNGSVFISPDFAVLDRSAGIYRLGEEKSFIVRRGGVVSRSDLELSRLQTAVGILALRHEHAKAGVALPPDRTAFFIFATPYGLEAHRPFVDALDAEIEHVERAIVGLRAAAGKLARLRQGVPREVSELPDLAGEFRINFRESCIGRCILAPRCERMASASASVLGDEATDVFGAVLPSQLPDLIARRDALTGAEGALVRTIADAAAALGLDLDEIARLTA